MLDQGQLFLATFSIISLFYTPGERWYAYSHNNDRSEETDIGCNGSHHFAGAVTPTSRVGTPSICRISPCAGLGSGDY